MNIFPFPKPKFNYIFSCQIHLFHFYWVKIIDFLINNRCIIYSSSILYYSLSLSLFREKQFRETFLFLSPNFLLYSSLATNSTRFFSRLLYPFIESNLIWLSLSFVRDRIHNDLEVEKNFDEIIELRSTGFGMVLVWHMACQMLSIRGDKITVHSFLSKMSTCLLWRDKETPFSLLLYLSLFFSSCSERRESINFVSFVDWWKFCFNQGRDLKWSSWKKTTWMMEICIERENFGGV